MTQQQVVEQSVTRWICGHLGPRVGGLFEPPAREGRSLSIEALSPEQKLSFREIAERVIICSAANKDAIANDVAPKIFHVCLRAFIRCHPLALLYKTLDGQQTERRIEPHAIVIRPPLWYLLSYDLEKKELRTFRLDCIQQAHFMLGSFERRRPNELFGDLQGIRYVADPEP